MLTAGILLITGLNSCLLTDKLYTPVGGKKGADIKSEMGSAAMTGIILGQEMFFSQEGTSRDDQRSEYKDGHLQAAVLGMVMAENSAKISDDTYYTTDSAAACIENTQNQAMIIEYIALDHTKNTTVCHKGNWIDSNADGIEDVPVTDTNEVDTSAINASVQCVKDAYISYGAGAGLISGDACSPKETGKIIHLGPLSL